MKIILAQPRGFCAGVVRAIDIVERALAKHGAPVYVRHEIVHNRHVVNRSRRRRSLRRDAEGRRREPSPSSAPASLEKLRGRKVAVVADYRRHLPAGHQGAQPDGIAKGRVLVSSAMTGI
jgi:hypothetical protein